MKPSFYLLLLFLCYYTGAFSQCSPIPYSGNHNTIIPITNDFPHAQQNKPFKTTFYLQVAHDTTTIFGKYIFDYIHVDSVNINPKPKGTIINYICNPVDCYYLGGNTGCMVIDISSEMTLHPGVFQIIVYTTSKGTLDITPNVKLQNKIDWYNIVVDSSNVSSRIDHKISVDNNSLKLLNVSPNPSSNELLIELYLPLNNFVEFNIIDISGKNVYSKKANLVSGTNKELINLSDLNNGIYFIQVKSNNQMAIHKIIIQN